MGYLCANFSLPLVFLGLSVLDLGSMYTTDVRQTSDRQTSDARRQTRIIA